MTGPVHLGVNLDSKELGAVLPLDKIIFLNFMFGELLNLLIRILED